MARRARSAARWPHEACWQTPAPVGQCRPGSLRSPAGLRLRGAPDATLSRVSRLPGCCGGEWLDGVGGTTGRQQDQQDPDHAGGSGRCSSCRRGPAGKGPWHGAGRAAHGAAGGARPAKLTCPGPPPPPVHSRSASVTNVLRNQRKDTEEQADNVPNPTERITRPGR